MQRELSRRRLLASTGFLASGAAVAAVAGASSESDGSDGRQALPVRWSRTYGDDPISSATAIAEGDGQYVGVGTAGTQDQQTGSAFGVDATTGEQQWSRTVENANLDTQPTFRDVVAADDGGFVLVGATSLQGVVSVVRTAATGEVQWWETFESESGDAALAPQTVVSTANGYVVGGYRGVEQNYTAITITVDDDGNEVTRSEYFADRNSTILGIEPLDEGFVAAGELRDQNGENEQATYRGNLFRVAPDRSVQWQEGHAGEFESDGGQSQFQDVVALDDGYLVVGNLISSGSDFSGWVVRTDASGGENRSRRVTPRPVTLLVTATRGDVGAVVGGQVAETPSSQTSGAWIAELDGATELLWNRTLNPSDANVYRDVTATSDGGYVAAGNAQSNDQTATVLSRAWLTKVGGDEAPDETPTDDGGATTQAPTATPTDVTTGAATDTPADDGSETADGGESGTSDDGGPKTPDPGETTTSDGGPGFGVGSALAAVGAGSLLRRSGLLGGSDDE